MLESHSGQFSFEISSLSPFALPFVSLCCMSVATEEKYLSDGRPRVKRKRGPKLTSCPFLKPATLQNFKDLALVSN